MILLGSQVKKLHGQYALALHTELKARAAIIAWQERIAEKFMIFGGYNFWVRYGKNQILPETDFSFEAFTLARREKSEAEVIRDFMKANGVPEEVMFLEELSSYTKEQAEILEILLKRTTFSNINKIAILTLIYHMETALPVFQETIDLRVEGLFAENLLGLKGEPGIEMVDQYYSSPKGGKQWDRKKIRKLLSSGRSIGELLSIHK